MSNRRAAFRAVARVALVVVPLGPARFAALERDFGARERPARATRAARVAPFSPPAPLPGAGRLRPRRTRDPDAAAWLGWLAYRLGRAGQGDGGDGGDGGADDADGAGPDRAIRRVDEAVARDRAGAAGGAPRRCPSPHAALPGGVPDETDACHVDAELDVELSAAGLRYPAPAGLAPRTPVACALGLPGADRAIGALAETVRGAAPTGAAAPGGAALVALRFVRIDEADADAVARHVMACQRAALAAPGAPARGATLRA